MYRLSVGNLIITFNYQRMKNGMTPLFTFDEMEHWFDHFQSKAEDKMLVFLQAGGEKFTK